MGLTASRTAVFLFPNLSSLFHIKGLYKNNLLQTLRIFKNLRVWDEKIVQVIFFTNPNAGLCQKLKNAGCFLSRIMQKIHEKNRQTFFVRLSGP